MTQAQNIVEHLKRDSEMYSYVLSILKELEDTQFMLSEMGSVKEELRKKVEKLESDLRLGRAFYTELKKDNEALSKQNEELKERYFNQVKLNK